MGKTEEKHFEVLQVLVFFSQSKYRTSPMTGTPITGTPMTGTPITGALSGVALCFKSGFSVARNQNITILCEKHDGKAFTEHHHTSAHSNYSSDRL